MSSGKGVYVHIKEFPITARIGTRQEFLDLRDKALELDSSLMVSYSGSSYWILKPGITWTRILPGSTLAHLLEKLEREYPQKSSVRVMLTETGASFYIAGSVPGYRYVCTEKEFMSFCDATAPGVIELNPLGDGVGYIDMRRIMEGYSEHPIAKELAQCYAASELSESSAKSNNHNMYFEFI